MRNKSVCVLKTLSATRQKVGRKKRYTEDMQARFAPGTLARIAAVLADGEERTAFVREAVERELLRRENRSVSND